jgi:cell division protein FtsB
VVSSVVRWRHRRAPSPERRRARTIVTVATVFAAVVLLTSFPLSEVLAQRSALSSTARELASMRASNAALARQSAALGAASAVNGLARHDYGFVRAGQRAYDILPLPGDTAPTSTGSGYVPLDTPPVVPGSAESQALMGIVTPATAGAHGPVPAAVVAPPRGYWARVLRSLEFWN